HRGVAQSHDPRGTLSQPKVGTLFKAPCKGLFLVPRGTGLQLNNPTSTKKMNSKKMTTLYLRKSIGLIAVVVCLATLGLGLSATARQPTFTTFDAPGAGTGADQGTIPFDITPAGEITGFTRDAAFARHGFVRARNGAIAVFDAPDAAGTGAGQGTRAYSQNPAGAITGWYSEATDVVHAYVRAANGSFTVFDAPGAGTGPFPQGTFSYGGINPAGAIAGYYTDDSNVSHGFLR